MLVTFEGIDGAGKTSLVERVAEQLGPVWSARSVVKAHEPHSDAYRYLLATTSNERERLFLFLADRARHLDELHRFLQDGALVLMDRYIDSTVAYVPSWLERELRADGLDLYRLVVSAAGGHEPARTFLLDLEPADAYARLVRRDGEPDLSIERLAEIRARYLQLAARFPHRITVLDANLPTIRLVEQVVSDIDTVYSQRKEAIGR